MNTNLFYFVLPDHYRPPHLVKSKIEHLVRTYKNANEVVTSSGQGLEDEEFDSFMEMIHNRHCKWYSALDTVLANRHNIRPAFTNEATFRRSDHSDTASTMSETIAQENNEVIQLSDSEEEGKHSSTSSSNNTQNKTTQNATVTIDTSSEVESDRMSSNESPRKKVKQTSDAKMSYLEAASVRRRKKKSIADKNGGTNTTKELTARTAEHFNLMYDVQREKMERQVEIQEQSMQLEEQKLELERDKLMRGDSLIKLQEEKLRGEIIKDITEHNFSIMKQRKEMKNMYPDMTIEQMDTILPLRKIPD